MKVLSVSLTPTSLKVGDILTVRAILQNDKGVTVNSQGPFGDFIYDQSERFIPDYPSVAQAYRFALTFLCNPYDHPFRWGWKGSLAPGGQVVITGHVRILIPFSTLWWGGLVQEKVGWESDNLSPTLIRVTDGSPDASLDVRVASLEAGQAKIVDTLHSV